MLFVYENHGMHTFAVSLRLREVVLVSSLHTGRSMYFLLRNSSYLLLFSYRFLKNVVAQVDLNVIVQLRMILCLYS